MTSRRARTNFKYKKKKTHAPEWKSFITCATMDVCLYNLKLKKFSYIMILREFVLKCILLLEYVFLKINFCGSRQIESSFFKTVNRTVSLTNPSEKFNTFRLLSVSPRRYQCFGSISVDHKNSSFCLRHANIITDGSTTIVSFFVIQVLNVQSFHRTFVDTIGAVICVTTLRLIRIKAINSTRRK